MATIPLKTWSWRGHSSGQNLLFFQVINIKLVVNEGTLLTIAIFYGKKDLLNVEENQPMASMCYF
jgi:hypothetical protein